MRKCLLCGNQVKGSPRTIPQNSYLHVICKIAGDDLGYSIEEMKQVFRELFLTPKEVTFAGETKLVYPSTSSLSKGDFVLFIDDIIRTCSQQGISLPSMDHQF
jgi:hypothetical protein